MKTLRSSRLLHAPEDKAIRKDVPAYGPRTSVKSIAQHISDIVAQDVDGKVTYEPPHTVALADEGDYQVPIPSSIGRTTGADS